MARNFPHDQPAGLRHARPFHMTELVDPIHEAHREALAGLLSRIARLADELGLKDRVTTLEELRHSVAEPFLFVIVGEVKSGKSSFINALLGADVCAVAPDPCTDRVNQIVYSSEPFERDAGGLVRKVGVKADILKTIAIVDTPGTGAILKEHQAITENFIPHSDLAIFVFSAVNPHTGAAWEMLDFVNAEWRKKVVFVLQQADRATQTEMEVNRRAVEQYAAQRGIREPRIFTTSAMREKRGERDSGFDEIREFIRQTVTGEAPARTKLANAAAVAEKILEEIGGGLEEQRKALASDETVSKALADRLANGERRSGREIEDLISRLELNYDRLSGDLKTRFVGGLSLGELFSRTIGPIFGSTKTITAWIEELKADFTNRLGPRIEEIAKEGAEHYLDGVRLLLNDLIADLSRARPASSATAPQLYMKLPGWHGETSESVVTKLRDLLTDDRFATALQGSGATSIPVAIGGGLATLIAVVTAAVAHVLVVDLTGGILTALTAAGAGLFVMFKRRSLIRDFEAALDNGRAQFVREVRDKLTAKLGLIYEEIRRVCHPFFDEVEAARKKFVPLAEERGVLANELQTQKSNW